MNQFLQRTLAAAVAVGLALPMSASALDKLTTEKDKVSYMVGLDLANGIGQIKDEVDVNIVIEAMKAQLAGGKLLMTAEESQAVRQSFMQKLQAAQQAKTVELAGKNKAEGDKYLAANKTKPGVKTTASGLQYSVIKEGTGAKPKATDQVKVHYVGTLLNGTKFDSSIDRGQPATFPLNGVIPGWTEALQLMRVGDRFRVWIPAALAYKGSPGKPAGMLVFDIQLLAVI